MLSNFNEQADRSVCRSKNSDSAAQPAGMRLSTENCPFREKNPALKHANRFRYSLEVSRGAIIKWF